AADRSPAAVLRRLVDLAVDLTGAGRGAMLAVDPDRGVRELVVGGIPGRRRAPPRPPPAGAGVVEALLRQPGPLRLQGARLPAAAMAGRDAWESLGEVTGAARSLAHADLALVTGTGGGRGAPRVLAADGTAACRLLGLPARPGPPARRLIADISGQEPPV